MKRNFYPNHFIGLLFSVALSIALPFFTQAQTFHFSNTYMGSNEVPANSSTGTGTITGTYDVTTNFLTFTITFSGLSANTTAAHFHGPAIPGTNANVTFPHQNFPLGVMSGTFGPFVNTLTDAQEVDLLAGRWYSNIHTSAFAGGEIRALIFFDAPFVAPQIACPRDTVLFNETGSCSHSLSFAATATGSPAPAFNYFVGPTEITSPYNFPVGTTKVKAIALNGGGVDSCNFTVTVKDTTKPVITCPGLITVFNDPGVCGANVNFAPTATDNCTSVLVTTQPTSGSFFPVGVSNVTATATDAAGNISTCTFMVRVIDHEPPVISDLMAVPDTLWPPNHKMKDVAVNYTDKDNCGIVNCEISVKSNEPDNGTGDGNTTNDWKIIDEHHVQLRSERSGNGNGRIYTITVTCTDQYGNSSTSTTTVTVPHDNGVMAARPEHLTGRISPNPGNHEFSLEIETDDDAGRIDVQVFDQTGRRIENHGNLFGSQTIRLGGTLPPGVYYVIMGQNGQTTKLKWLKMR